MKTPMSVPEQVKNLERIIEFNWTEWERTPILYKKDFYAKIIKQMGEEYETLTGHKFVRQA